MKKEPRRFVCRLTDGKRLPVIEQRDDWICIEEMFDFADGGPTPRPLQMWQPTSQFVDEPDEPEEPTHILCFVNNDGVRKDLKVEGDLLVVQRKVEQLICKGQTNFVKIIPIHTESSKYRSVLCTWKWDDDIGGFTTWCGEKFVHPGVPCKDGLPHTWAYCPYCGGEVDLPNTDSLSQDQLDFEAIRSAIAAREGYVVTEEMVKAIMDSIELSVKKS